MKISINLMAWGDRVGPEEMSLFPGLAALGYDGVEIPLLSLEGVDVGAIRAALGQSGLGCTVSSALPSGSSLLNQLERGNGIAFLRQCLTLTAKIGADGLCGPLYAPVGQLTGLPRAPEEWTSCVRALHEVGKVAEDYGVWVAIEPLNRFETYFLNTAADARQLVAEVDSPFVGILLDTFHMNIEEKDSGAAIAQSGAVLRHFHCSENDRGIIGSGQVPWSRIRQALEQSNYTDWLVCETFNGRIPSLAAATAIWRPLAPDSATYARESLRFVQALLR